MNFIKNKKLISFFAILLIAQGMLYSQDSTSELLEHIYALNESVSDPSKQVGNLNPDSIPSLPIGLVKEINGKKYIIAIDSAEFTPEGAYFDAYMALELPDSDQKIAFAAKHIKFNPRGVLGGEQAKLVLVSDHYIDMGPNTELFLPGDGTNYVEWGCNGFEAVNLHGAFRFSDGILVPDSSSTDSLVTADFQIHVTDVNNMIAEVNFSPFEVRGLDDFVFTITKAYVDLSDYDNPPSMVSPQGYTGASTPEWRGFYLKNFNVRLPSELEKNDGATSVYAHDLIIDDAGVSGRLGVNNLFTTDEKDMSGWGFSVDNLEIELTTNQLTGGQLSGVVQVPALDDTDLGYAAIISTNANTDEVDYNFTISTQDTISMSCFKSSLDIHPSSNINVQKVEGQFKPTLVLNGNLDLTESVFKLKGVGFQQLTLVTDAPYITNGVFSLVSNNSGNDDNNLSKFPISVTNIVFGINQGQVALGADVALNLSGDNSSSNSGNSFSCSSVVKVLSKSSADTESNKINFEFDKLIVNTIDLEVNTTAFYLKGLIDLNKADPIYGDGFYGSIAFRVKNVMSNNVSLACAFGKVNGFKYFFVDASVPVNIQVGTNVTLTSLMGGISNHMTGQQSTADLISQVASGNASLDGSSQVYVPDANAGLSFRAGVGFKSTANESNFNGDVLFSISFNSNGGLDEIALIGDAYMLVDRASRKNASRYVHGTVSILYDNVNQILDIQANCNAQYSNAITGAMLAQVYYSPQEWFIKMGSPSAPAYVNVANLAYVNAYLMLGQNLPPMPSPPAQVMQIFSNAGLGGQRDDAAIVLGNGIATGMNFNVAFDNSIGVEIGNFNVNIYAMGNAGAGFDMTMLNYGPTAHCSGSSDQIGMNGWYLQGQLYAYFTLNIGVTGRALGNDFDVPLINGSAALLLQGKLPKPTYVNGAIALNAQILGLININLNYDFEFGNNCNIIQS